MAIRHFERSYATARSVLAFLEVVGWISVGLGALSALIGFATGGLISSLYGETPFLARIISALPGLFIFISGLFSVAYVQVSRAHVDTAEMTRELLYLAKNAPPSTSIGHASSSGKYSGERPTIKDLENIYAVGDQEFTHKSEAQRYLNSLLDQD